MHTYNVARSHGWNCKSLMPSLTFSPHGTHFYSWANRVIENNKNLLCSTYCHSEIYSVIRPAVSEAPFCLKKP